MGSAAVGYKSCACHVYMCTLFQSFIVQRDVTKCSVVVYLEASKEGVEDGGGGPAWSSLFMLFMLFHTCFVFATKCCNRHLRLFLRQSVATVTNLSLDVCNGLETGNGPHMTLSLFLHYNSTHWGY